MRNTTHGTELIRNPVSGNVIGFSLGADFCAEHEWGIDSLKRKLELPIKNILDNWNDMIIPASAASQIEFMETKDCSVLRTTSSWAEPIKEFVESQFHLKSYKKYDKERLEKTDFFAAWDSKGFMIAAISEVARRNLKAIYENFSKGNVVLSQMRSGPFRNGGISLSFNDKIDNKTKETFNESCADTKRLHEEADKTGIKQKLDEKNGQSFRAINGYYALSPRWKFKDVVSKYPVTFWLNPMQQDSNNYGNFTVEDLELWLEGKGPIPKVKSPV